MQPIDNEEALKKSQKAPEKPRVEQSEELTQEVFHEHEDDGDPEKHRGNFQGGFKYDEGEKK